MKFLVVLVIFVACARAGRIANVAQKFVPSFSTGFVIKGHEAEAHKAPYMCSLSRPGNHQHICGCTVIAKEWVLTAAHCISNPVNMSVAAGLHQRRNFDNKTQLRRVDWGVVHEKFAGGVGPFDIALLHVGKPFEMTKYVQPAVLPAAQEKHSGKVDLYGFGQTKHYLYLAADVLQTVSAELLELEECRKKLPEKSPLAESNICSDSMEKGISACNGDSGGPLVIEREGAPSEVVGIVSWGMVPCGLGNMPSVYTRVSSYNGWISYQQSKYYKW